MGGLADVFPDELPRCRAQGLLGPVRVYRQAKSVSSTDVCARAHHGICGAASTACSGSEGVQHFKLQRQGSLLWVRALCCFLWTLACSAFVSAFELKCCAGANE